MRLRLYADRTNLEAVLRQNAEWLNSRSVCNAADASTLARIYNEIKPYNYLCAVVLTQSDEKRLQDAANHLFTVCETQAPSAVRILSEELQRTWRPAPDIPAIREAYAVLRRFARSDVLEELLNKSPGEAAISALEQHKEELQRLLDSEHTVNVLSAQCHRMRVILDDVAQQSKTNETAHTCARDIAAYVHHKAKMLQLQLAEHLSYALTSYPPQLRTQGVAKRTANTLVKQYENDCSAAGKQLAYVAAKALQIQLSQPPLQDSTQLLVGVRSMKLLDELQHQLEQFGTVDRFSYIPYLLLRTDTSYAAHVLTKPASLFHDKKAAVYAPGTYRINPLQGTKQDEEWNLRLIGAPKAWKRTRGEHTRAAIIDTGVEYDHPDLADRFDDAQGVDFVNSTDPLDDNGHGTHVAGTVAGKTTGVAPMANLYAVKVLNARGSGSEVAVLKGIEWAIEKKVDVINMSLGSSYRSSAEAQLVLAAYNANISVACAAGNEGNSSYNYPASHKGAISVAAVTQEKRKAPFSNYNDMVDLAAPGVSIYSTWIGGGYNVLSGTSMATPHVAGACALLRSAGIGNPEGQLKHTAESLGQQDHYGSGLIRVDQAL